MPVWRDGMFLVVLVAWKVCVAINSTPTTCILAFFARFIAFGRGGFIGNSVCSCLGGCSPPIEGDESISVRCAVPGQTWCLDGTCLQFSLTVTHHASL